MTTWFPWKRPKLYIDGTTDVRSGDIFVFPFSVHGDCHVLTARVNERGRLVDLERKLSVYEERMTQAFNVDELFSLHGFAKWNMFMDAYFGKDLWGQTELESFQNNAGGQWLRVDAAYIKMDLNNVAQMKVIERIYDSPLSKMICTDKRMPSPAKWDAYMEEIVKMHRSTVPQLKYLLTDPRLTLSAEHFEEI